MVALDADTLQVDSGLIAMGDAAAAERAATNPSPSSPACQAALSQYRVAMGFRIAFGSVAFLLTLALAVLLAYALYQSVTNKVDAKAIIAFAGGAASGLAFGFIVKRMQEASNTQQLALEQVGRYCGTETQQQLS